MTTKMAHEGSRKRIRLAILVNTIAPYRLPIYAALSRVFETIVLHGGTEANRSWDLDIPESLRTRKVFTLQIPIRKQTGVPGISDVSFVHLNGGLLWWLPNFRPDIVISNELGFRTLAALAYSRVMDVPLWVWWGGTPHSEQFVSGRKKRFRLLLARSIRNWISYGASSSEYLSSLGVEPSNILQIQNCVPHEVFLNPSPEPARLVEDLPSPVILSVGQLIARKGLDKLIEACGRLQSQGRTFSLVIVGNGPERESLRQMAEQLAIQNIRFLPNQNQQTLNSLYRQASVFVFPTMEDIWGLVVNEALWAGCPVLCSRYAGCAGEIVPEENVFDPVSPESFDAALQKIFDNTVTPADSSRLLTCAQVSDLIARALQKGTPMISRSGSEWTSNAASGIR